MNAARRRRVLARVVVIAALVAVAPAAAAEEPTTPTPIVPVSVRPLTAIESGRNDANPVWARSGKLIAFERSRGDRKEIVVAPISPRSRNA